MSEQLATWFDDAAGVFYVRRVDLGVWEFPCVVDHGIGGRLAAVYGELTSSMTPEQIDEILLSPDLAEPGDVGTMESLSNAVRRVRLDAYARLDLDVLSFIQARVRSRSGVIGGFHVKHESGHVYSEADRALIGTLAGITSLALS